MSKIIRTPTRAEGGITPEEKLRLDEHAQMWTKRILRTDPIEPDKIVPALKALYRVSGLKEPRVVIVPSPLVMAMAGGAAAAIWHLRKTYVATRDATDAATRVATYEATRVATRDATDAATRATTYVATDVATREATRATTYVATRDATDAATRATTYVATDVATREATRATTYVATRDATDAATRETTYEATRVATLEATDVATREATRVATLEATREATLEATYAATYAATDVATDVATDEATRVATRDATRDATSEATSVATDVATRDATRDATSEATSVATDVATREATYAATDVATREATLEATRVATYAATDVATREVRNCQVLWWRMYQGGNMWAQYDCYLTAARDILGLRLAEHDKYAAWEQCAIHGGFRIMHPEFCMVSDFPIILKQDEDNRPHCDNGPSHQWRDGWSLYHWHGVRVTRQIIECPETLTVEQIAKEDNSEVRRVMLLRLGAERFAKEAEMTLIHEDKLVSNFPSIPETSEVEPGKRLVVGYRKGKEVARLLRCDKVTGGDGRPLKFVQVSCPSTGREYILRVRHDAKRAYEAVASTFGMTEKEYKTGKYLRQGDVALIPLDGGPETQQHS